MAAAEAAARAAAEARARARRRARAEQKAKEEAEAQYWAERNAWRQEQNAIRRQKSAAANALRAEQDAKAAAAAAAKQLAETYDRIDRERELGRQSQQQAAEKAAAAAADAGKKQSGWDKALKIGGAVLISGLVVAATLVTGGAATAVIGVALSGAIGGYLGGMHNEKMGESFANGYIGGAVSGLIQGVGTLAGPAGIIAGSGVGAYLNSTITDNLNNNGKPQDQRKSADDIKKDARKSFVVGAATGTLTAGAKVSLDMAQSAGYIESIRNDVIAPVTSGFNNALSTGVGAMDDAIGYDLTDRWLANQW